MTLRSRIAAAYDLISAPEEPIGLGLQALAPGESSLSQPSVWMSDVFGARPSAAGKVITPETSMRVAAVYACVRVLSQSIAQLPLVLYRRVGAGAEPATDHPLYPILLNLPNSEMTSQDAREMAMNHLCLRGNAYFQIIRAGGMVTQLNPLNPEWVRMERRPNGNLFYKFTQPGLQVRELEYNEVWRIIGMSFNGIVGVSPLTYAREAIGLALGAEEHGSKLFVNGAQMATAIEVPGNLTDEQYQRMKTSHAEEYSGSRNAHKTMILEAGGKISKLSMTNVDSQFIESRRFQLEDICRFYNVPPHKVQELARATFNNIEHLTMDFKNSSLAPWMVRFEQTGNRDLLLPSERNKYFLGHDTSQLDRADTAALANLVSSGIANTWLSPNEARAMFKLNPREGGDKYENPNVASGTKPNTPITDPAKG